MSSPVESRARSGSIPGLAPSVRVRRTRAPTLSGGAALAPIPSEAVPATFESAEPELEAGTANSTNKFAGRRRRGTITERLFSEDSYLTIAEDERGPVARARSSSRASRQSSDAGGRNPVEVILPEKGGNLDIGRRRSRSLASRNRSVRSDDDDEHHYDEEVQVLDVLDPAVSATTHLANIQAGFWPNALCRQPVVELSSPSPEAEHSEPLNPAADSRDDLIDTEELDPLDSHLGKLLEVERRKARRKEQFRQTMRGVWAFMKTPVGVLATIYMLLIVVVGAALVLLLMIPMGSYAKKLWVEICSQILTGLFVITSLLPLPWRIWDTYNIWTICHYAIVTRRRRAKLSLPPLRDPNDLPERPDTEFWVGPGGVQMTGPRPVSVPLPPKQHKHKKSKSGEPDSTGERDDAVELATLEHKIGTSTEDLPEEVVVLTEKEQARLHRCQLRYAKSQTYYRPHTSPTHHAFPLYVAFYISLLMIGNSVFQAALCGCMWGMDRFERPAWTTAVLIVGSFGCMIAASVLMPVYGERTKRKAEVSRKVWLMLKKDEEELAARRAAIQTQHKADKDLAKQNRRHHWGHGHKDKAAHDVAGTSVAPVTASAAAEEVAEQAKNEDRS